MLNSRRLLNCEDDHCEQCVTVYGLHVLPLTFSGVADTQHLIATACGSLLFNDRVFCSHHRNICCADRLNLVSLLQFPVYVAL